VSARVRRRTALQALAAAPLAALVRPAEARDYASAAEVLAEIDRLEADLDARMAAVATTVPGAAPLARSMRADHERHRVARAALRRRLRIPAGRPAAPTPSGPTTVAALTALGQELVHAHAEGLPALDDARAVDVLAHHMVDDARHLALLQLWGEAEEQGG
jgi:hypothetical protein